MQFLRMIILIQAVAFGLGAVAAVGAGPSRSRSADAWKKNTSGHGAFVS